MEKSDVTCGTIMGTGSGQAKNLRHRIILIDEAAQATEPETLVAIVRLSEEGTVILIGDHNQLPPTTHSKDAKFLQGVSLFGRLMETPGIEYVLLDEQYRMHPTISRWPSELFYGDRLKNAPSVKNLEPIPGFPWPEDHSGVAFVHCDGEESQHGNAFSNDAECDAVQTLIRNLLGEEVPAEEIGVITLYDGQRLILRQNLDATIEVKNVDSFQGREKSFIVISMVRTGRKLGFITSGQRLNVAISRARRGLVIMGNFFSLYNGQDPEGYLWELVNQMYQNGYLFRPTERGFESWVPKAEILRRDPPAPKQSKDTKGEHKPQTNITWTVKDDVDNKDTSSSEENLTQKQRVVLHLQEVWRIASELWKNRAFVACIVKVMRMEPHKYDTWQRPLSCLNWDRKAWSHQNFFVALGVGLDPGNWILFLMFQVLLHIRKKMDHRYPTM